MRKQCFLLLLDLPGALNIRDDRRPVVLGEDRHETQSELPHAQTRRLRIAVRVGRLEEYLQSVAVQRLHTIQKRFIDH